MLLQILVVYVPCRLQRRWLIFTCLLLPTGGVFSPLQPRRFPCEGEQNFLKSFSSFSHILSHSKPLIALLNFCQSFKEGNQMKPRRHSNSKHKIRAPNLPGAATSTNISHGGAGLNLHFRKRNFRLKSLPSGPQRVIMSVSLVRLHISITLKHTNSTTRTTQLKSVNSLSPSQY